MDSMQQKKNEQDTRGKSLSRFLPKHDENQREGETRNGATKNNAEGMGGNQKNQRRQTDFFLRNRAVHDATSLE